MGRPPLKVKPTNIRLPVGIGERIDALVGPKRRAEFIRDAVVAEVERREAEAAPLSAEPKP
jgi:Arc/MetJ-type ribon-helix-helix transcriptional regulator